MYPFLIKDALDIQTFGELWYENLDPRNNGWTLSNRSLDDDNSPLSWTRMALSPDIVMESSNQIRKKIEKKTNTKLLHERINTNGQTSGQVSEFHTDYDEDHITALLFCCMNWNSQWGGAFTVKNSDTSEYLIYPYIPNQAVVIPSEWEHYGESPNHFCQNLRVTIAFMYKILR